MEAHGLFNSPCAWTAAKGCNVKRIISALVCAFLFALLLLPGHALAFGVAIGPQTIDIDNAMRGIEYERVVTVFNPSGIECTYRIGAEGDIASWLTFYDRTTQKAVERLSIAGESNVTLIFKVKIPSDTINNKYAATIFAETALGSEDGTSGASTVLRSTSALTVKVSGEQIVSGTIGTITVKDTEAGLPMRVLVNFQNTGNVSIQPKIDAVVSKGNDEITTFTYNKTTIKPDSQENIPVEWVTAKDQVGDYVTRITVSLGDNILETKEIPFKVLAPGTLTKTGEFVSLGYDGKPALDSMLKIQSLFKSTGQADVRAKLIGEVYYDGNLIDTIKSEETLVPVDQTGTLISYLKLQKTGEYAVKAYVSYEGKQTGVKEIKVNVAAAQLSLSQSNPNTSVGSSLTPLYLAILLALFGAASIGIVTVLLWRRRSSHGGRQGLATQRIPRE